MEYREYMHDGNLRTLEKTLRHMMWFFAIAKFGLITQKTLPCFVFLKKQE